MKTLTKGQYLATVYTVHIYFTVRICMTHYDQDYWRWGGYSETFEVCSN